MATPYDKIRSGEDALYFLHIPKTAGTTLYAILDTHFASGDICPWNTRPYLQDIPQEQWQGFQLYRGHFGTEFAEFLGQQPITMTMLRDPVDSAISALHHERRAPVVHDTVLRGEEVLDFVRGPRVANVVSDRIRRHLVPDNRQLSEDESVERAVKALDECAFVGITERFAESMALLAHTMGWTPPGIVQNLNVRPRSQAVLPPDAVEIVRSHVGAEDRVYEHARCLFESRLATMHYDLLDLEHRRRRSREPARNHVQLRFDEVLPGHGWHGLEDLQGLVPFPFRWSGPGAESTLDFRLRADRDLQLRVHMVNAVSLETLASLTLHANDCLIPLEAKHQDGLEVIAEGTLPAHVIARDPELTRLRFCVDRTRSKHSIDSSDPDTRLLGVCFSELQIAPTLAPVGQLAASSR